MNSTSPITRLRLPATLLAGALILGIGLLAWTLSIHADSEARLAGDSRQEQEAAQAASAAPDKLRQSQENAGVYEQLRHSGFLGPEQRTGWVTALGHVQTSLRLESLSWRLMPQAPSPLAPGLRVSTMALSASPVDAAGLDTLLGHLRKTAPGRFTVESCSLALNPTGLSGQAECRLNWWTWENGPAHH
jgi:hypothetical protein